MSIEEGLKGAGYEITTTDWLDRFDAFYQETYKKYEDAVEEKVKGVRDFYQILGMAGKFDHPTGIPITDEDVKGDYRLDDMETENLHRAASCYKNLIVAVNAGGVIDVFFWMRFRLPYWFTMYRAAKREAMPLLMCSAER